jgi:hypothetical protein
MSTYLVFFISFGFHGLDNRGRVSPGRFLGGVPAALLLGGWSIANAAPVNRCGHRDGGIVQQCHPKRVYTDTVPKATRARAAKETVWRPAGLALFEEVETFHNIQDLVQGPPHRRKVYVHEAHVFL